MKKVLLTLTAIFTAIISFAQIQSNCNVPSILYTEYDEAVTDLAIRRMYQVNSPDTVYITVPQTQKDSIWEGLAAIFNAPTVHGWDSTFNKYCIKQNININPFYFLFTYAELDTNYSWTQHWLNNEIITGYTELDNFIARYSFNTLGSPFGNVVSISSDLFLNSKAFADSLLFFDGITNTTPINGMLYSYNEIRYNKIGNTKFYDFVIRYGPDCQSGCQYWHTFKYKVEPNCSVEFLGIDKYIGPPFPSPTNCNIATTIVNIKENNFKLSIYPNPAKNTLFLEIKNSELKIKDSNKNEVYIYDVYGREVSRTSLFDNEQESTSYSINVSNLEKGVYFVKVDNNIAKFVKE